MFKTHKTTSEVSAMAEMYRAIEALDPGCRAAMKKLISDHGVKLGYKHMCRFISGGDTPATIEYGNTDAEVLALINQAAAEGPDSVLWKAFEHPKAAHREAALARRQMLINQAQAKAQAEAEKVNDKGEPTLKELRASAKAKNGGKTKLNGTLISDMPTSALKEYLAA